MERGITYLYFYLILMAFNKYTRIYVRGSIWQMENLQTIYWFHKLSFDNNLEYFNRATHDFIVQGKTILVCVDSYKEDNEHVESMVVFSMVA